jgi:DNA-binding response OmpR family regulator
MLEAEGTLTPGSTFLHKPFTPAELRKAVNELLAK